jgi:proteic killer suppression protein
MINKKVMTEVLVHRLAEKQIDRLPKHLQESLRNWVETVERIGIRETRLLKGYHDEPLKGRRTGERSIRLNRSYRAIYVETIVGLKLLLIEVNKHEY